MPKKITTNDIKEKLIAERGGRKADWKRLSKKKDGANWRREFENKATAELVAVIEDSQGNLTIDAMTDDDKTINAKANGEFSSDKKPSTTEIRDFKDLFHDEISHILDDIMEETDPKQLKSLTKGLMSLHNDFGYTAEQFHTAHVSIAELVSDEDNYSRKDVWNRFVEMGFFVNIGNIYYVNGQVETDQPNAEVITTETDEEALAKEVKSYVYDMFLGEIMACEDISEFEDLLMEFNYQNEYYADVDVVDIELKHIKDINIPELVEKSNPYIASTNYKVDEVKTHLSGIGFIIDGDTLVRHKTCVKTAPNAKAK